jgi:hypothetical protein
MLWILAVAVSEPMWRLLKVKTKVGWPPGVFFFGDDLLRVGVVVASKLPRNRGTLLVRFMVAGALLPSAIADLAALLADAIERGLVEGDLVHLERALGEKPRRPEEEEIVAMMKGTFTEARKMGRDEGRAEEAARNLLTVLRVRGIAVPDVARERILAQKDPLLLERWHEKAIVAGSVGEVIDDPS